MRIVGQLNGVIEAFLMVKIIFHKPLGSVLFRFFVARY